jgi:uncharacterized membrane protein YphA (DoxX/SURF4 family)
MKKKSVHKNSAPVLRVDESVSLEEQIASAFAATMLQFVCAPLLAIGLFTRVNAALLTATLSVAILQNVLAGRDPQLAILYVLVMAGLIFLGGGRLSLDAKLDSRWQRTTASKTSLGTARGDVRQAKQC